MSQVITPDRIDDDLPLGESPFTADQSALVWWSLKGARFGGKVLDNPDCLFFCCRTRSDLLALMDELGTVSLEQACAPAAELIELLRVSGCGYRFLCLMAPDNTEIVRWPI